MSRLSDIDRIHREAGLQSAGGVRLQTYLSSSATALSVARWDDLVVAPTG